MMRIIKIVICTAWCFLGLLVSPAAQITEYLDHTMQVLPDKLNASLVRNIVMQEDSSVLVEIHFLHGGIKMKGAYKNPSMKMEHGFFTYYFANGVKESEGNYFLGDKTGTWKRWDWEGNPRPDRVYPSPIAHDEPETSTPAIFPGGIEALTDYVSAELRFPEEASTLGAEGWVYTAFTIGHAGEVKDIEVIQSAHRTLNLEAKRIIKCMPTWHPAMKNGSAIESKFILPIVFESKKASIGGLVRNVTPESN